MAGRLAPFRHVIHRDQFQLDGLRLLLVFRTNGMVDCLLVGLHVFVCIRCCRMVLVFLSLLTRLRLVLARAVALAVFL